jgi:transglutaminase-like putative cysteine protease
MAKRISIIFTIWISLFFPGLTWGTLYYYSGTMDSRFDMTHTFVIVVPAGLSSLNFIATLPEEYSLPNTTQSITGLDVTCSVTPSVEDYTDIYENHYKKLVWSNPHQGNITVTISYTVSSSSDWRLSIPADAYPFDSTGLPDSVTAFLLPTDEVQSDDPLLIDLVSSLTSGLTSEWEVLAALNGWIIDNIYYGDNPYGYDALNTYFYRMGTCSNYAHIGLALVRAAGIPARIAVGYSLTKSYTLLTGGDPVSLDWGQGTHAWIEVYYPSLGWVPYDPQRDLHHVDTHRVLMGRGIDATDLVGKISWTFDSVPSSYPRGYETLEVDWIDDSIDLSFIKSTSEIISASYSSVVPVIHDHTINASAGSKGSISPAGKIDVSNGSNQKFIITPNYGYEIEDVLVDGVSQGSVTSYTFDNITADHTITAQFVPVESNGDGGYGDGGSSGSTCFISTIGIR